MHIETEYCMLMFIIICIIVDDFFVTELLVHHLGQQLLFLECFIKECS